MPGTVHATSGPAGTALVSDQVQLALIAAGAAFLGSVLNSLLALWKEKRDREWRRQDEEWKNRSEARGKTSLEQQGALMAQAEQITQDVQANTAVSVVAAAASQTGAAAAVKTAAHLTGETEQKIHAELADVRQKFARLLNPSLPEAQDGISQEPPGPAAGTRPGPR